jgi:hypothetical protein
MTISGALGTSAYQRLKKMFGKEVIHKRRTHTFDPDTGDEIDSITTINNIIAIFDMDNDITLDRRDGRHTVGVNLIYVDGDIDIQAMDVIVDGPNTYQIEDIRRGVGSNVTVYQGLVINKVI